MESNNTLTTNDVSKFPQENHGEIPDAVLDVSDGGTVLLNSAQATLFASDDGRECRANEQTDTVENKYEELQELGRGGMGRVVLWKDRNINRVVATKMILEDKSVSTETLQRFFEEGQITGQLEHPNIVPIYEMGLDKVSNLYFTMKYVKGHSLKNLLEELVQKPELVQGEWSLNRRLNIFLNICNAISYAHSKNVIHRDLKPDNIMLGNFGEVMVMDWGLAKVLGQGQEVLSKDSVSTLRSEGGFKTITGQVSGTPLYMSPEQAQGELEKIDHRSDIYSLGVILYEFVTGTRCVEGESIINIITKVSQGNIKDVPNMSPLGYVPKELRHIIGKTLQLKREARYQSVREMADDIQKFLDGREVSACRYTLWDKLWKCCYKYRRELALVISTIVILVPLFWVWHHVQMQVRAQSYARKAESAFQKVQEQLAAHGLEKEEIDISFLRDLASSQDGKENITQQLLSTPNQKLAEKDQSFSSQTDTQGVKANIDPSRPTTTVPGSPTMTDKAEGSTTTVPEAPTTTEKAKAPTTTVPEAPTTTEKAKALITAVPEDFSKIKDTLIHAANLYRKAYEEKNEESYKEEEAKIWYKLYLTAKQSKEKEWEEIALCQIKNLLNK